MALCWSAHPLRAAAQQPTIVLAASSSLVDSGLLAQLLPAFTQKTGIAVTVIEAISRRSLDAAAHDKADLVLVNDPAAEQDFIMSGQGIARHEIAWNDFLLAGPKSDPARIGGTRNAVAALHAIAEHGTAFVARRDHDVPDAVERRLWSAAEINPLTMPWYHVVDGGQGTALDQAARLGAVVLTDRGTWLAMQDHHDLVPLVQGDSAFINRYDVIQLNPSLHPTAKLNDAKTLADWLASPDGQNAIGALRIDDQQLFHPDADRPLPGAS